MSKLSPSPSGSAAVRSGAWQTWKPSWMCGQTLHGSTVGLVGLGRIGRTVAGCLKPFGVTEVVYSSRSPPSGYDIDIEDNLYRIY